MSLMRAIKSAIAAMFRALGTMVWKVVRIGDRLIGMFIRQPMPIADSLEPAEFDERDVPPAGSEFAALRNLVYARLTNSKPAEADLGRVSDLEVEWIGVLTPAMLQAVMKASDPVIHAHLMNRRGQTMRGVVKFDEDAVDDFRIAQLRERAKAEAAKRSIPPFRYA